MEIEEVMEVEKSKEAEEKILRIRQCAGHFCFTHFLYLL